MFSDSSEDGGEKRTVFNHNLGMGTRKGVLQPSDKEPELYKITFERSQVSSITE